MDDHSHDSELTEIIYDRLVVPVSMRSIYWQHFGFPASADGIILTKQKVICMLCSSQITYNKNTSNLRMHLQNKHLHELTQIENNADASSCKSRMLRKILPDNTVTGVDNYTPTRYQPSPKIVPGKSFFVANQVEEGGEITILEESDQEIWPGRKGQRQPQKRVISTHTMTNAIVNHIVSDLVRPDITEMMGFQRLMLTLKSPCEIPSYSLLTQDIIPFLHRQAKEKLKTEILNLTCDYSLSLEEWHGNTSRSYLTIRIFYHNFEQTLHSKVLTTIFILKNADMMWWEAFFHSLFAEYEITVNRVIAVVYATSNENILNAIKNAGYFAVPCLNFAIKECVNACLEDLTIKTILGKVRDIIAILKNYPQMLDELEAQIETNVDSSTLECDVESIWLSTLNMLDMTLKCRSLIQAMDNVVCELKEEEWEVISDVVDMLTNLNVTLQTLSEEKSPVLSLFRPLLWQIIGVRADIKESDSKMAKMLKTTIVNVLSKLFDEERIRSVIYMATLIDPRFKKMPLGPPEEKNDYINSIVEEMARMPIVEPEEEERKLKRVRISGMEILLGNYKCKEEINSSAKDEYTQFFEFSGAPLDACPIKWWHKNRDKYLRVQTLADKYMCVPAIAIPGSDLLLKNALPLEGKRALLPSNLIDPLIFLHYNKTSSTVSMTATL